MDNKPAIEYIIMDNKPDNTLYQLIIMVKIDMHAPKAALPYKRVSLASTGCMKPRDSVSATDREIDRTV